MAKLTPDHSGNSTVTNTITAPPSLTLAQKWNNLPSGTKLAIYCSAGGAGALVLAAMLFTCVRQRRKGRQERDRYNAQVEQEREQAYKDQIQLREKGLGGWDAKEFASQGDDALGGWGGNTPAGTKGMDEGPESPIQRPPTASSVPSPGGMNPMPTRSNTPGGMNQMPTRSNTPGGMNQMPGRNNTPGSMNQMPGRNNTPGAGFQRSSPGPGFQNPDASSFRSNSPAIRSNSPAIPRMMSPAPSLAAPQPQRTWNGAAQGAMNPAITSYGSPRSPTLPNIGRGPSRGGYQRF
jgi:hypothetical protein